MARLIGAITGPVNRPGQRPGNELLCDPQDQPGSPWQVRITGALSALRPRHQWFGVCWLPGRDSQRRDDPGPIAIVAA